MSDLVPGVALEGLLSQDEIAYSYLFPYRDNVPVVGDHHPFANIEHLLSDVMLAVTSERYIGWAAKVLLNLDLFPMQIAQLRFLWRTARPILVASRGSGKCIDGDAFVVTDTGFVRIRDLVGEDASPNVRRYMRGRKVLGEKGFTEIEYGWKNIESDLVSVKTRAGLAFKMTPNHPVRCVRNGSIEWVQAVDLVAGDRLVVDRNPNDVWPTGHNDLGTDVAYLFGCLTGDGCISGNTIILTSADVELVDRCNLAAMRLWGKKFVEVPSSRYGYRLYCAQAVRDLTEKYGFDRGAKAPRKDFPSSVLSASKESIAAFVRGLMDTDGWVEPKNSGVAFCSASYKLVRTLHFILTRFGVVGRISEKHNVETGKRYYRISVTGQAVEVYARAIGFGLTRKRTLMQELCGVRRNTNVDVIPDGLCKHHVVALRQAYRETCAVSRIRGGKPVPCHLGAWSLTAVKSYALTYDRLIGMLESTVGLEEHPARVALQEIRDQHYYYDEIVAIGTANDETYDVHLQTDHSFISGGIISHNSYILAAYALMRALLDPGAKIVIVGAGFRQAKVVFNYVESIWNNAPILRDICGGNRGRPKTSVDSCYCRVGPSFICAIPMGDGSKIRGLRATVVIADEFASISEEIFDTVVQGFAATHKSPVDEARRLATVARLKGLGIPDQMGQVLAGGKISYNQIIYSGTASYAFNHFAKRHDLWRDIIKSRGNRRKLLKLFGSDVGVPEGFDWRDFGIMRIPYTHVQPGLLDSKQLASAQMSMPRNVFLMEYGAVYVSDSDGYYKRSMLESCTPKPGMAIQTVDGPVEYTPAMNGDPDRKYVMGIDPASEMDNLAIVVAEVWGSHARIVYCWSVNKPEFERRKQSGLATSDDYYAYCCSKVRELCRAFRIVRIEMDSQGGGYPIAEMLRNSRIIADGERPIYEVVDRDNPRSMDGASDGPHILHLVQPSTEWNIQANYAMHKGFETRKLFFPCFDTVKMQASLSAEKAVGRTVDTYEDCVMEIESLKDEICLISITETAGGKPKFGLPGRSEATSAHRGTRLKKDRYSALLMAYRYVYDEDVAGQSSHGIDYDDVVGNMGKVTDVPGGPMYRGPGIGRMRNAAEYLTGEVGFGYLKHKPGS